MAAMDAVLAKIDENRDAALGRLFELLRIPSISTDPAYAGACEQAATYLADELSGLGFKASVRPTAGRPMVLAHAKSTRRDVPHVLFYGHYDVQPVDPRALWASDPFAPELAEVEGVKAIVARGASDDKGQLMTFVEACRGFVETGGLPCDVTILFEGEEETGSPSLPAFLSDNKAELKADLALVCDTGMWDRDTPAVTTMLRGLVLEEVVVTAANRDLHSGMYGGAATNPINLLARIIADLHGTDGRVQVEGFYDGVEELPREVADQWKTLPFDEAEFLGGVGLSVAAGEQDRSVLEKIWSRPTCDVNGIQGGYQGSGSKTVLPAKASAKVSFRLVGKQNPAKVADAFRDFVRERLPADCKVEFISHGASPALSLPFSSEALNRAKRALHQEWDKEPVMAGSGGSIPIVGSFKQDLKMDTLMIGFALDDDRIHSPNEKYDLTSFQKGARSWARILNALTL
ncbi:M20/M25/M40 family metallo-hydrolase [Lichenihabitans sp. Uapishka_5]|uniref:M20/M25/M40 family metallo-hydrolase n=1 Tax=Lichenihabitans sp. Uapishka_5 TaxID=3037302 RepID=UPI0029E81CB5|nr:M20/M25/M40 family metallo-hydrolase [Lichenihabitans sp. Uapishka_5]MDX7950426.1 M20/M25/M40 family metallo-hydrolase [Lichenihabitans sp. Uapishka_5]